MFHHNFFPKPKIDLKDADISQETRQKLQALQQNFDDIVSKHSSDIRLIHLEEMTFDKDPNFPPIMRIPYQLPLKHYRFVKEEIKNLLKVGLIERYLSPSATPIIVVHRQCNPGALLTQMKGLVIDYCELNKQIPKVHTIQAKSKDSLALIETA